MRVNYKIWSHSQVIEREIFLSVGHSHCSLLPMSGGEFVSNLWDSSLSHSDLNYFVSIVILRHHNSIYFTSLSSSCYQTNVL